MKKKGFTLVELLAVIAILAILVIIALPNIMSLFNEAKKNSFTNEVKELFKTAENQWMSDSMISTSDMYYSRVDGDTKLQCITDTDNAELKLSGRTQLQYGIKVDKAGHIMDFVATDGTYMYQFQAGDTAGALQIADIGSANATAVDTQNAVVRLADYNKTDATITCASGNFSIN